MKCTSFANEEIPTVWQKVQSEYFPVKETIIFEYFSFEPFAGKILKFRSRYYSEVLFGI